MALEVSIQSASIIEIGSFKITSSVIASYSITFIIFLVALYTRRKTSLIPSRIQLFFEMIAEFFIDMLKSAYGSEKKAKKFFPYILSLFIFLIFANQFGVIPLLSGILVDGKAAFRTPTSDWNQTAALALVAVASAHLIALSISPFKHIGSYIKIGSLLKVRSLKDLANALLEIFLGLLDIIGEFAKVISMSARLFGNIFAGDVMIAVIASISVYTSYVVPIPFMFLSIFSGFVQALVFSLLVVFFMAGTINNVSPAKEAQ